MLSDIDRLLLNQCLAHEPQSWERFVERFLGLVVHVINHTAHARALRVEPQDVEDLASEVFLTILSDDFNILRRFRGDSSLATYLTVIARRVVVRELLKRRTTTTLHDKHDEELSRDTADDELLNRDEVEQLISHLDEREASIVKMYYLEGKSYEQIGDKMSMPSNSVGPTISRARAKMRRASVGS